LYSKTSLVVLAVLIIFMIHAVWDVYTKEKTSAADNNAIEAQLAHLQDQTQSLNGDIDKLKTNEGVESTIRQNFHMGTQGEQLVIVTDVATSTTDDGPQDTGFWDTLENGVSSMWQKIVSIF
jgi:cell division protein FtsB